MLDRSAAFVMLGQASRARDGITPSRMIYRGVRPVLYSSPAAFLWGMMR
jgi:hypothetical protein